MKKTLLIVALVLAALAAFGAGTVFAQDAQPPYNGGGRGPMVGGGQGALHDFMATEFAKKLDLNVDDINARINAGETMYDIALSAGVTAEEFPALMTEVRGASLDAAVAANVLTQEQADFMKTRGQGMGGGYANGTGSCPMGGTGSYGPNGTSYGPGARGQGMMGGGRWNQQTTP